MRQYFYLVCYSITGDDTVAKKIFLQESEAIRYGRRMATIHKDRSVYLYKQEICRTAELQFVKQLTEYLD